MLRTTLVLCVLLTGCSGSCGSKGVTEEPIVEPTSSAETDSATATRPSNFRRPMFDGRPRKFPTFARPEASVSR